MCVENGYPEAIYPLGLSATAWEGPSSRYCLTKGLQLRNTHPRPAFVFLNEKSGSVAKKIWGCRGWTAVRRVPPLISHLPSYGERGEFGNCGRFVRGGVPDRSGGPWLDAAAPLLLSRRPGFLRAPAPAHPALGAAFRAPLTPGRAAAASPSRPAAVGTAAAFPLPKAAAVARPRRGPKRPGHGRPSPRAGSGRGASGRGPPRRVLPCPEGSRGLAGAVGAGSAAMPGAVSEVPFGGADAVLGRFVWSPCNASAAGFAETPDCETFCLRRSGLPPFPAPDRPGRFGLHGRGVPWTPGRGLGTQTHRLDDRRTASRSWGSPKRGRREERLVTALIVLQVSAVTLKNALCCFLQKPKSCSWFPAGPELGRIASPALLGAAGLGPELLQRFFRSPKQEQPFSPKRVFYCPVSLFEPSLSVCLTRQPLSRWVFAGSPQVTAGRRGAGCRPRCFPAAVAAVAALPALWHLRGALLRAGHEGCSLAGPLASGQPWLGGIG
ncbi:uncharacterized protein LOC128152862 [Harpia harpyja]|uniref:uncharacterized protein LOC128152862 n=1 Tax=Harpia harpyja TaxID=202280 RepID=UPI0022B0D195|nr:uncharacterized protein LOC128152862 [Harpia harpyja]